MSESGNHKTENHDLEPSSSASISSSSSTDFFVGREWVFLKLIKTLDLRIDCPSTTVILGCPGAGKTVLLRRLKKSSKFRKNIIAYYECTDRSQAVDLIESLESQLKNLIKLRKSSTISEDEDNSRDDLTNDAKEMFKQAILFPLIESDKLPEDQFRSLIVIDSVDLKKDICELVSNHIHLLPKWLHLVVTARPKRRKGFTKMFSGSRKIVIDEMRKVNVINDMKSYIVHRIKAMSTHCPLGHAAKKALNQIGIKSNGCFLYVKIILDCIERNIIEIDKEDIGATLNGLYFALFTKLLEALPERQTIYNHILSVILACEDHKVSIDTLNQVFGEEVVRSTLQELSMYCLIQVTDAEVTVLHQSVSEWITDVKHCTKRFLCQPSLGHTILALANLNGQSMSRLCHHIENSNVDRLEAHHYATWLLLSCKGEDVNDLLSSCHNSFIVDYIKSVAQKNQKDSAEPGIEKCVQSETVNEEDGLVEDNGQVLPSGPRVTSPSESNAAVSSRSSKDLEMTSGHDGLQILVDAIRHQFLDKVQSILKHHHDLVNMESEEKKTPLFYAIESRNKNLVEILIESDADVNRVSGQDEVTPLMIACKMDLVAISESLLEADADVDACDVVGRTPLVYAIKENVSPKIVEMLLFWGAHTDYIDPEGRSLLCIAAGQEQCNVEIIKLLLAVGCDELHKDNFGRTPLHFASLHGITDVIEALIDVGGDILVNSRDNEGKTGLHIAAGAGYLETCKLLLTEKNINMLSHDGQSPLRIAAFAGNLDIINYLFENGADLNYVDADGRSTLYCLATSCQDDPQSLPVISQLIKLGSDLEACDPEKRTPLHVACMQGLENTVRMLLTAGCNIEACDTEDRTPLHMCAWNGFSEIASLLIAAGANINHVSGPQRATPLLIAAQQGHIDVCAILLAAGADVHHVDAYDRNAQEVAANCGHRHIASLIDSHVTSGTSDPCPTMSSHASTAETAPITDFDRFYDFDATLSCKPKPDKSRQSSKASNPTKGKKLTPMGKLSKLLR